VGYGLGGYVHELATQRGRESDDRNHRLGHVRLERLEEKEAEQHDVVEGCVGCEAQERQLRETEVLEGPVHEFVRAALMIRTDDGVGRCHELDSGLS